MESYNIYNLEFHNMFAVVMAGGNGTRFWPLSTISNPKQLLNLTTDGTLIQKTVSRITPLIPEQNIFIVTNTFQREELRRQVSEVSAIPSRNIIVEPVGRNTLPCIGLAALYIKSLEQSSTMTVLPSDHFVRDEGRFLQLLCYAQKVVQEHDCLVTLGIKPSRPETGYGYISLKNRIYSINGTDIFKAEQFTEKPDRQTATEFLASGKHLWNSGMFVWRTSTLLEMIERFAPDISVELSKIEAVIGTPHEQRVIQEIYPQMRSISVDYAIMEKADNVLVIPADFGWSDIGSWAAIDEVWQKDANSNVCMSQHIGIDTSGCTIYSDKLVATIGLEDVAIIETEKALLVCPKSRAQEVKIIVERLEQEGLDEYL